jgi:AraC-like DNA-binding protein/quercetin dioxygenase-like cupin family protein
MSEIRQLLTEEGFEVRSLAVDYRGGTRLHSHFHDWPQLVYAARGVMTVDVGNGSWVVPPHRAVWVPEQTHHEIEMTGNVAMRTLYLAPHLAAHLSKQCQTIEVSPLLKELILETIRMGMLHRDVPTQQRLIGVLVDQLSRIESMPLRLPMPEHARLRAITERLRANPLEDIKPAAIATEAGMSVRTLERVFAAETNLTFVQWRQRMRMLHALRLLATGEPVTSVALSVGYNSPSAFIAAFKRELGVTPGDYFAGD